MLGSLFYSVDNMEQSLDAESSPAISLPKDAVLGEIWLKSSLV